MEKTTIATDSVYETYEGLLESEGLRIVEIHQSVHGKEFVLDVYITRAEGKGEVDSKDCDKAYRLIYPVAQGDAGLLRDLSLSVSTPGLFRTLKDASEFSIFTGRWVRLYDTGRAATLRGVIVSFDGEGVTLGSVKDEKSGKDLGTLVIPIEKINKAKLDYVWEDAKDGN